MMRIIFLINMTLLLFACSTDQGPLLKAPEIQIQQSGSKASFRGIGVKNAKEAWVSGTHGTVLRTVDGGEHWLKVDIQGTDSLDFRDLELLNDHSILLMSIGTDTSSQIFKSVDNGENWKVVYVNKEPDAFFDGFDFWDENSGILISDAIDEKLYVLKTMDGGEHWSRVGAETLPDLENGEYGFAASGTGIVTMDGQKVWIATGGSSARVFYSSNQGMDWSVVNTPMVSGSPSKGSFSITFKDENNGVAVGGDYQIDSAAFSNVILTQDGGKSWNGIVHQETVPFKSCVTFLGNNSYLAVGTSGVSWSSDDGKNWTTIDTTSFHTMDFDQKSGIGWMAGGNGTIAKYTVK